MESMPARRFLAFVARLPHYEGAIRHAATLELQANQPEPEPSPPTTPPTRAAADDQAIATSVDLMAIHPVWGSVGAYSKAPAV